MINGVKWKRREAGFYDLRDDEDQPCAFVEKQEDGTWFWWLASRLIDWQVRDSDESPHGIESSFTAAKEAAKERYELAVSLPGIISGGVQRIMAEQDKPVEQRAQEAVAWIASWVNVEVSVLH